MFRSLFAVILSIALALPIGATSARAGDREDIAKVLGGLAALYLLQEALTRPRAEPVRRAPVHSAPIYRTPVSPIPQARPAPRTRDRIVNNPRRDVRLLPRQCAVDLATSRGTVRGYRAKCMQNAVARPGILPPQCLRNVETVRGVEHIYAPRCLDREGWSTRTARR